MDTSVIFSRPFTLTGLRGYQPAGKSTELRRLDVSLDNVSRLHAGISTDFDDHRATRPGVSQLPFSGASTVLSSRPR